jgi:dihydrofolate reductase
MGRIVATQHVSLDGVIDASGGTKEYVVSSTCDSSGWSYAAVLEGDPVEEVARLRAETGHDFVVHGSPRFLQTLLELDLLDELRLLVHPIDGKRLRLETADAADDGVTVLVYESAG